MGIKDFYKYVKTRWPECFVPVAYDSFRFQRVAIDMMNVMYTIRARVDRDRGCEWLDGVVRFLLRLRDARVHPVCVFDGLRTHPLKQTTVDKRRDDREKGKQRVLKVQTGLEHYLSTRECTPEFQVFLDNHLDCVSMLTGEPIVGAVQAYLERTSRSYNLSFHPGEIEAVREVARALGMCVLAAEYDGEALCAYLSARGDVEAVLSNDSDVFFFGATRVLFRFSDDGAFLIDADHLFQSMGITRAQFINLCLLCGTDFNDSVRGIGFCRAYALVQQYTYLDVAEFPLQLDHALLDQVRAFTRVPPDVPAVQYTRRLDDGDDRVRLAQLWFRYQLRTSLDDAMAWTPTALELDDSDETIGCV